MNRRRVPWSALIVGGALLVAVLYIHTVPPQPGALYPPCVFHSLTGWHCPGCGATRCLHALLRGDLYQAVAWNLAVVLVMPLVGCELLSQARALWDGVPRRHFLLPAWLAVGISVSILAFGLLRNIPVEPFTVLAPHRLH